MNFRTENQMTMMTCQTTDVVHSFPHEIERDEKKIFSNKWKKHLKEFFRFQLIERRKGRIRFEFHWSIRLTNRSRIFFGTENVCLIISNSKINVMSENVPSSIDEAPSSKFDRPLRRTSRLSVLKPQSQPIVENKEEEEEETKIVDVPNENEEEDPPELYQPGDIIWYRVTGNPWWPALVFGCYYEDFLWTRVLQIGGRHKRREYFVYFFGPSFEYVWTRTNFSLPFEGLEQFIQHAEEHVSKATHRGEQEALANRYELKVSARKRPQWDKAIEEANEALKLTREERIKNFEEILKSILDGSQKKEKKRDSSVGRRQSRKSSSSSSEVSIKRLKPKSSSSSGFLHIGWPNLTINDEKRIIQTLLDHPDRDHITLNEGQSFACQLVTEIVKENSHLDMTCVQIDWFYDLLIKYSSMIRPLARWFDDKIDASLKDSLYIKQSQLKNLLKCE